MKGRSVGASVDKGDPAADGGTVVSITGVGELLTGAENVDVMNREGTGPVISVAVTVGTKVVSTREVDSSC